MAVPAFAEDVLVWMRMDDDELWALGSGSAARGALGMLAFGLVTAPLLFALGAAARGCNPAAIRGVRETDAALLVPAAALDAARPAFARWVGPRK